MAEQDNVALVRSIYATGCWDVGVDAAPAQGSSRQWFKDHAAARSYAGLA